MSGALVLWRDGVSRPVHTSLARAFLNAMMLSSRHPLPVGSLIAMRAASELNSVTYIERNAAKALPPPTGFERSTSRTMRLSSSVDIFRSPA